MAKERRSHASPFSYSGYKNTSSSSSRGIDPSEPKAFISPVAEEMKEWEGIYCPVCLEHPHNAVLLMCTSHGKGCRPFMCDTSYRHSNCFDQFKKMFSAASLSEATPEKEELLRCPLCRGHVTGWEVIEPARRYMNSLPRSCSMEKCEFKGAYRQLRKHARREHPSIYPTNADPERLRDWTSMERERDIGDLISSMRYTVNGSDGGRRRGADELIRVDGDDLEVTPWRPLYHRSVALYLVFRVYHPELSGISRQSSNPSRMMTHSRLRRRRRGADSWGEEAFNEQQREDHVGRYYDVTDDNGNARSDSDVGGVGRGRPRRRHRWIMSDTEEEEEAR